MLEVNGGLGVCCLYKLDYNITVLLTEIFQLKYDIHIEKLYIICA